MDTSKLKQERPAIVTLLPVEIKNEIPVVDSRFVAGALGIKHKTLMETIRRYQAEIEEFGSLLFQTAVRKRDVGATTLRFCYLNENQAIFIGTLSRNTKKVVSFKSRLVQSFAHVRKTIQEQPLNQIQEVIKRVEELTKSTKETEKQIKLLKSWQTGLANEITDIKAIQATLPPEEFNPLFTQIRKELGQMIRDYVNRSDISTRDVYRVLYTTFSLRHDKNIYRQAQRANKKPIEWLESTGWIMEVYEIAKPLLAMPSEEY